MVADMKRTGSYQDGSEEDLSSARSAQVKFKVKKIQIDRVTDGTNTKQQSVRELFKNTSETGFEILEDDVSENGNGNGKKVLSNNIDNKNNANVKP
jgi:hypothetical protein